MTDEKMVEPGLQPLRKWIHDLNNTVGVILASVELLQLEELSPKAAERSRTIEQKALEARALLLNVADRYLC
jgi:hypothetical protein